MSRTILQRFGTFDADAPKPYCVLCNRNHAPGQQHRGDHGLALLGWFLLLVASAVAGVAAAGTSVGVW